MSNARLFNYQIATEEQTVCPYCVEGKTMEDYVEYEDSEMSNFDFMRAEEGTYDPYSGCFTCSSCYIRIGMPLLNRLINDAYLVYRLHHDPLPHQDSSAIQEKMFGI